MLTSIYPYSFILYFIIYNSLFNDTELESLRNRRTLNLHNFCKLFISSYLVKLNKRFHFKRAGGIDALVADGIRPPTLYKFLRRLPHHAHLHDCTFLTVCKSLIKNLCDKNKLLSQLYWLYMCS